MLDKVKSANIAELAKEHTVLLVDCYADWCNPCHALTPILEEIQGMSGDKLKIVKLDIEESENRTFIVDHNVRAVPVVMLYLRGEYKDVLMGARPKEKILEWIASHTF